MPDSLKTPSALISWQRSLVGALIVCLTAFSGLAQQSSSRVRISVRNPPEVNISIETVKPTDTWSFKNAYAGAIDLADRIERFQASRTGQPISVTMVAAGEFRSKSLADKVSYIARIPPQNVAHAPHISWLISDVGLLMLADLLPNPSKDKSNLTIDFDLPPDWLIYSTRQDDEAHFNVAEPEKSVFMIGRGLHARSKSNKGMELRVVTSGKWNFTDKEVLDFGLRILERYQELTGFKLRRTPTILIAASPTLNANSDWNAETRGSTTVLLLNQNARWRNWSAHLGLILTHELFHLWVPNSLALSGDYDWFFEGFTSYIALRQSLSLKLIRFQEFLDTLVRVYDSYLRKADNMSLLEASERRWTSATSVVYDQGMLTAFLYDLIVRRESGSTSSLEDRYRSLFARFVDEPADANDVIIQTLTSTPATSEFAHSYIETRNRIELEKILPAFGINIERSRPTPIWVNKEIDNDQKRLLRSLGYRK